MSSKLADFGDGELWKSVEIGVFSEIADRESSIFQNTSISTYFNSSSHFLASTNSIGEKVLQLMYWFHSCWVKRCFTATVKYCYIFPIVGPEVNSNMQMDQLQ